MTADTSMQHLICAASNRALSAVGSIALTTRFTSYLFIRIISLFVKPYKARATLLRYFGDHPYISPRAHVSCSRFKAGPKTFIDDYVTIYSHPKAEGVVEFGRNVHVFRHTVVELGDGSSSVRIGDHTHIQPGCNLNAFVGNITIGKNCMIAPRCAFMPYQHSLAEWEIPMRQQPLITRGDIVLEEDVWLGVNVSVLDNVRIGRGAVVGAGAVVTRDIPAYAIAVGIPARVVGSRKT